MMQYPEVKMDMLQFGRLLVRPIVKLTSKQVGSNYFDYVHDKKKMYIKRCPKRNITF